MTAESIALRFTVTRLAPPAHAQELPTTRAIDSRLGESELVDGFPTDATVRRDSSPRSRSGVFSDVELLR